MMRPGLCHFCVLLVGLVACAPKDGDGSEGSSSSTATGSSTTSMPTSSGTTEEPAPTAECKVAADCVLIDNCCECSPKPANAEVAACEGNCDQSTCEAQLRPGVDVTCRSGRCVFAEVVCDGSVICDLERPTCPEGTTVSVKDQCWGPCMESRYCNGGGCPLEGCGEGWMCVAYQASGLQCVPVPLECEGAPSCACTAPYLDEFCPASCVDDGAGNLTCQDGG